MLDWGVFPRELVFSKDVRNITGGGGDLNFLTGSCNRSDVSEDPSGNDVRLGRFFFFKIQAFSKDSEKNNKWFSFFL